MKAAYADPPYIGLANYYPEKQEVDHKQLIAQLETYDAWALSLSSPTLQIILPMCPDKVRVGAWIKPFASFKPGINPVYAWEPLIFYSSRKRERYECSVVDYISCSITFGRHMIGAKPEAFCFWIFELLNLIPDDEFYDLYPGSGAVSLAWEKWKGQFRGKKYWKTKIKQKNEKSS